MRRVVLVSEKVAVYKPCNVARMTGVSLTSPVKAILPASCILPPKKYEEPRRLLYVTLVVKSFHCTWMLSGRSHMSWNLRSKTWDACLLVNTAAELSWRFSPDELQLALPSLSRIPSLHSFRCINSLLCFTRIEMFRSGPNLRATYWSRPLSCSYCCASR